MGLDMYLFKVENTFLASNALEEAYGAGKEIELGYWRKANQIHKWFCNRVANGEDNCQPVLVSKELLSELLDTCRKVFNSCKMIAAQIRNGYTTNARGKRVYFYQQGKTIENPALAKELLPTAEGFFFGGTDYDEGYYSDIVATIEILEGALKNTNFSTETVFYQSSW
jgi:hypothetical protein